MIYGLNFGGPAIPTTPRSAFRKFKERIRVNTRDCQCFGCQRTAPPSIGVLTMRLVGIGQCIGDAHRMVLVAHNGTRKIHVEPKQTAGGTWYGLYVY
jgi:hypothetical protein